MNKPVTYGWAVKYPPNFVYFDFDIWAVKGTREAAQKVFGYSFRKDTKESWRIGWRRAYRRGFRCVRVVVSEAP